MVSVVVVIDVFGLHGFLCPHVLMPSLGQIISHFVCGSHSAVSSAFCVAPVLPIAQSIVLTATLLTARIYEN